MLITRNNYETFFLLYADNELCAEEQLAVENFVAENEDLRGELDSIMAAILPLDNDEFCPKESLYKNSFVDGSLQEMLLLKIDNELSAEELTGLSKTLFGNQAAIQEEQILLATKLDATEALVFPNKELLYKKERDNVVVFSIMRWAAAAILIGFGLFFGFSIFNKNTPPNNTVAVKENSKPVNKIQENIGIKKAENVAIANIKREVISNEVENSVAASKVGAVKKTITPNVMEEKILIEQQKEFATNKGVENKLTTPENITVENSNATAIAAVTQPAKVQAISLVNDNIVPLETIYAQAVSLTEIEKSNNKILYMDEEDVKRSKVGGVFKKFKRIIERTAKIKTGNPIRIAGFQIGTN